VCFSFSESVFFLFSILVIEDKSEVLREDKKLKISFDSLIFSLAINT
jgi:hypothetical protein